jgi:hypothetical protein
MGRVFALIMAVLLLGASWAGAGTFNVMSEAKPEKVANPVYIPPTVVKAEWKSIQKSDSMIDVESEPSAAADTETEARSSTKSKTTGSSRVGASGKSRTSRGMAPSPKSKAQTKPGNNKVAQTGQGETDLDKELEMLDKDLVLSPPPPSDRKRELSDSTVDGSADAAETGSPRGKKAGKSKVTTKKPPKATATTPSQAPSSFAGKPIRKVKPISGYLWNAPAGTSTVGGYGDPMEPMPLMSEARPRIVPPEQAERFVREGVTIKLAPRTVPATYPNPQMEDSNSASELVSTMTEIIGLPFAFISSLF